MIDSDWYLVGFGIPAAVALAAMLLAGMPWTRPQRSVAAYAWAMAMLVGATVGFAAWEVHSDRNPFDLTFSADVRNWLILTMPLAALAAINAGQESKASRCVGWLLRLVVAFGASAMLLRPRVNPFGLSQQEGVVWIVSLGVAWLLLTVLTAWHERRTPGHTLPGSLAALLAVAGVCIMLNGAASVGLLALGIAGVGAAAWLGGLALPAASRSAGSVDTLVAGLMFALIYAHHYSELPLWMAATLAAAPLLAWLVEPLRVTSLPPAAAGGIRVALILIPAIVVLVVAVLRFQAAIDEPDADDDSDYYGRPAVLPTDTFTAAPRSLRCVSDSASGQTRPTVATRRNRGLAFAESTCPPASRRRRARDTETAPAQVARALHCL